MTFGSLQFKISTRGSDVDSEASRRLILAESKSRVDSLYLILAQTLTGS